jgi:hypothetical protein
VAINQVNPANSKVSGWNQNTPGTRQISWVQIFSVLINGASGGVGKQFNHQVGVFAAFFPIVPTAAIAVVYP